MKDLKSIFSLNGTNYHQLDNSDKLLFDKLVTTLRVDLKSAQLTSDDYFDVTRDDSDEYSFKSPIHEPLQTKIWTTLLELRHEVL